MARASRPKKKPIFVACEGQSEQSYMAFLQQLANGNGCHVSIKAKVFNGAGDPFTLVEAAVAHLERQDNQGYQNRFIVFDTDRLSGNPDRNQEFRRLCANTNFQPVAQNCCFEAFLIRHFEGHENDDPPTANSAIQQLRRLWRGYEKGTDRKSLVAKLGLEAVKRAANALHGEDFKAFLCAVGLNSATA